jgi:hypothetical protein
MTPEDGVTIQPDPAPPRRRGRPSGSKNKPGHVSGWPKGKPRGPRKPKVAAPDIAPIAAQESPQNGASGWVDWPTTVTSDDGDMPPWLNDEPGYEIAPEHYFNGASDEMDAESAPAAQPEMQPGMGTVDVERDGAQEAASKLDVALALAANGLPILPVRVEWNGAKGKWEKTPLVKGWTDDGDTNPSSTNPNTIRNWWHVWPGVVAGIALGRADLVVIDTDRHPGGEDGVAAFEVLVAQYKELNPHPVCQTAGGGEHHYFKQLPGMKLGNSSGELPSGIDVRGVGGFAVAPGAVRPDGARWKAAGLAVRRGAPGMGRRRAGKR